jgi:pimeloyl-ACP methyl ester carboxylesterase
VLDAAGVEEAALVGNSMGAQHALDAVVETPDRCTALVWVGGGISGFDEDETPEEAAAFAAARAASDAGDADGEAELDLRIWVDGVGQPEARVPREVRDAVLQMDRPLLDAGRVFGRIARLDPPADGRLEGVAVPVLAVVGALDTFGTRQSAARLAERVPGARLVTLPDVAHMVGMEAPERLASLIVEHLAPLPRWS